MTRMGKATLLLAAMLPVQAWAQDGRQHDGQGEGHEQHAPRPGGDARPAPPAAARPAPPANPGPPAQGGFQGRPDGGFHGHFDGRAQTGMAPPTPNGEAGGRPQGYRGGGARFDGGASGPGGRPHFGYQGQPGQPAPRRDDPRADGNAVPQDGARRLGDGYRGDPNGRPGGFDQRAPGERLGGPDQRGPGYRPNGAGQRPPGAFDQRGPGYRPGGPDSRGPGYRRGGYDGHRPDWNRGWHGDRRYDWSRYRVQNRAVFHLQPYYAPPGWRYGYRRFDIGVTLDSFLWAQDYWIDDPWYFRLPPAYGPYRWVRYYNDALLVDIDTGEVVDVVHDIFY